MTKKKAIRVGHRGAARRVTSKIEEELEKETTQRDEIESLCETLKKKRDILSELDNEILEEIAEENMEAEIEDSDRYVLDIERILTKIRNSSSSKQKTKSNETSSNQNLNPNAADFVFINSTSTCNTPHPMQNNGMQYRSSMSATNSSIYHKLPKLNLPYFNGNLLKWQPFWDAYQSTIHDNQTLTDVQKFTYLQYQIQGIAAQCIAGLPLTSANYYQAVSILRERFGQNHKITNAYIQNLMDLPAPRSNADSLRNFSDRIECSIRGLESLGTNESTFGAILTPIIYNKLPSDVRKNITRDRGNDDWDIESLRTAIKREVCVQVAGQSTGQSNEDLEILPTASFIAETFKGKNGKQSRKKCLFCEESHHPNTCKNVKDVEKRKEIVKRKKVCFNCFGSHRVAEYLARKLEIESTEKIALKISGFGGNEGQVRHLDKANIAIETVDNQRIEIEVIIVPKIAAPIQTKSQKEIKALPYLRGLRLAHPICAEDKFNISLLIGADYYWSIVEDEIIRGNGPTAVKSKIGYLLSGPVLTKNGSSSKQSAMLNILTDHRAVVCDLEKFWNLEALGVSGSDTIKSQSEVVREYGEKSIILENGKYTAKLPWKPDFLPLPHNMELVKQRTSSVIRRLANKPDLLKMYGDIIREQERRHFIEKVEETKLPTDRPVHYIPHHPVSKESSTTPIRIVYDCSCKDGRDNPSLNECLESHPPVMNDITGILMRFRAKKYATTSDLEKAFLQIQLDEKDRDATRFLWLSDPTNTSSPLITYRFKSVLFGATCSPFILSATLLKHFKENPGKLSDTLEHGLYVDNILTSFDNENDVIDYYRRSRELLTKSGFNLRSWNSNSPKLQEIASKEQTLDKDELTKILGMQWNAKSDKLFYQSNPFEMDKKGKLTKRYILRQSSKIFDPLGLLSPVTVKAKIFMQSFWKLNLEWDEILTEDIQSKWILISRDLASNLETEIHRSTQTQNENNRNLPTLHVFTDASTHAYGACTYIMYDRKPTIVMAKNRVAPIKTITLPKLELMGAVIGARLVDHICKNFQETFSEIQFWSDSQIVLSWLSSVKPQRQFIKNRIEEITSLCGDNVWRYCPTKDNPADLLTRGITSEELQQNEMWFSGPKWLNSKEDWPTWNRNNVTSSVCTTMSENDDKIKTMENNQNVRIGIGKIIDIERYNSYRKLTRITAYVMRFATNCKATETERKKDVLRSDEIKNAKFLWIRYTQGKTFSDEINCIDNFTKRKTLVRQLKLFLDKKQCSRCGGRRIDNATVGETVKFPYLLPAKDRLTHLIVLEAHENTLHSGINITLAYIQQTFWIPKLRQCVKSILMKCVTCRKVIGKSYPAPEIPPLPKERVQDATPFSITGVDFTGALTTRNRHNEESKVYICLFTCAVTRAVHLELVYDLSEESFLLCFRRFVSRRSVPKIMMSDNALTFKAASNEISRLCNSRKVKENIQNYGIEWKFIPNRAPWFGGMWERMIGLTKISLKKVLGRAHVNNETLRTVLTEIEATLNDRPVTYISTDIRDPEPLTPSHLIHGRRITTVPYGSSKSAIDNLNICELTHTNLNNQAIRQRQLIENFWTRWKGEYLTSLREYHQRAGVDVRKIKEGDVVQIHDESKRVHWKLGVVQDTMKGKDGLVRVAMVRTKSGITNRPVTKLYPLEVNSMDCYLRRSERRN
ncbi:uncharacterized protein LOC134717532 [Mytilus trossulus]|uniref:uncharacterized protein LOC134717532 n=1 Tax=Mytilus trossulus TaxID=6551 RepID=UPI003005AC10